jgi:hypothetical protein
VLTHPNGNQDVGPFAQLLAQLLHSDETRSYQMAIDKAGDRKHTKLTVKAKNWFMAYIAEM